MHVFCFIATIIHFSNCVTVVDYKLTSAGFSALAYLKTGVVIFRIPKYVKEINMSQFP